MNVAYNIAEFVQYFINKRYEDSIPVQRKFSTAIDDTTTLHCFREIENAAYNCIIFRGGPEHGNDCPYYVRLFISKCKLANIYLVESSVPLINLKNVSQIENVCAYCRKRNNLPLILLGYSLGGVYILSYLAQGGNAADRYLTVCSPVDMNHFFHAIGSMSVYRLMMVSAVKKHGVNNIRTLFERYGCNCEEQIIYMNTFEECLMKNVDYWKERLMCFVGGEDYLTKSERSRMLFERIKTIIIPKSYHCDYDVCTHVGRYCNGLAFEM